MLTVSLHHAQEAHNHLGARPDHDLTLAGPLGVVDAIEGIIEHTGANHGDGVSEILRRLEAV